VNAIDNRTMHVAYVLSAGAKEHDLRQVHAGSTGEFLPYLLVKGVTHTNLAGLVSTLAHGTVLQDGLVSD
jgi:hypothetical protein